MNCASQPEKIPLTPDGKVDLSVYEEWELEQMRNTVINYVQTCQKIEARLKREGKEIPWRKQ